MSNSDLIDCTRETKKLRMRERECRSGGDAKSRRQIKKDHRLQVSGGGPRSEGRKIEGRDVIVKRGSDVRQMWWWWSLHKLSACQSCGTYVFLIPTLYLVSVQLWPQACARGVAVIAGQAQGGGEPRSRERREMQGRGCQVGGSLGLTGTSVFNLAESTVVIQPSSQVSII